MFFDPVDQGGQPVTLGIKVGCIDLENIAGKDDLGVFTGSGNDGLHLMRGEVLGLIHDETYVGYASATDISQRGDHQFLIIDRIGNHLVFLVFLVELVLDELQVVPQRFHVGI